MAAQIEEVVVDSYLVESEGLGPDISESLLDRILGAAKPSSSSGRPPPGAISAFRSSLPLGASGSESKSTKVDESCNRGACVLSSCADREAKG